MTVASAPAYGSSAYAQRIMAETRSSSCRCMLPRGHWGRRGWHWKPDPQYPNDWGLCVATGFCAEHRRALKRVRQIEVDRKQVEQSLADPEISETAEHSLLAQLGDLEDQHRNWRGRLAALNGQA